MLTIKNSILMLTDTLLLYLQCISTVQIPDLYTNVQIPNFCTNTWY